MRSQSGSPRPRIARSANNGPIVLRRRRTTVEPKEARTAEPRLDLRQYIDRKNDALLSHRYFVLCASHKLNRQDAVEILKQLYCFSIFYERLMMRRVAQFSTRMDHRVLEMARAHLREELGHSELFRQCLVANGVASKALAQVVPKMFTKALFGYLLATLQHENEYVGNVAILQVMESIGLHFFRATVVLMRRYSMPVDAIEQHAIADEWHASMGMDMGNDFDEATATDCRRVIDDLYRLMDFVLDEWISSAMKTAAVAGVA